MKNKLPPYWIVKNDSSQEFKDTVINYLNETYRKKWGGGSWWGSWIYYWYDWNNYSDWTNAYNYIEEFENNPKLLTLKQFKKMTKQKEKKVKFKVWEQVAVSNVSEEDAITDLVYDPHRFYYTWWKNINWLYVIEISNWDYTTYRYIAKIPKPKTIKIKDVNWNEYEIEESKLIDLWFNKK